MALLWVAYEDQKYPEAGEDGIGNQRAMAQGVIEKRDRCAESSVLDALSGTGDSGQTGPNGPGLCVVIPRFGARSEVWAVRQVALFRRLRPTVLTWAHENVEDSTVEDVAVLIAGTPGKPENGRGRWLHRLRNSMSGNFFGSIGRERAILIGKLEETDISVILCHFGQTALRLLPVAGKMGLPLVAHFHGLDISSSLNNRWYRWSLRRMIRRFSAVICVGSKQKEKLLELGVEPTRIHLIPCGVPTADFQLTSRARKVSPITFICVSRLVEWKGVHHCIAAFAKISDELEGATLVVVGEGPFSNQLRQLATELGVGASVEFTGAQREDQVRELLESADVFLQHSLDHSDGWFEGFGVSIAEAASIGLPVVVSACGGIMDQVVDGETGLIVKQRDERAMADAMLRLALDPDLRERMGIAGRARMIEHFDTTAQVAKLEEVLIQAAGH